MGWEREGVAANGERVWRETEVWIFNEFGLGF